MALLHLTETLERLGLAGEGSSTSDAELLSAFVAGDMEAFGVLVVLPTPGRIATVPVPFEFKDVELPCVAFTLLEKQLSPFSRGSPAWGLL
jgi:hypothetical protein